MTPELRAVLTEALAAHEVLSLDASPDNLVRMNIPKSNPLFWWIQEQRFDKPIPYVTLTVGGIEARLALTHVPSIQYRYDPDSEWYIETEWMLLRSAP
ncbi:hypothetical protein SEA_SHROOMBOI_81 [Mycobacterium phage ShroomBoi]|nr:hypothetical protein SEA_SHROOMBOI_81 [Mycobacterium phage ShroomBoi]